MDNNAIKSERMVLTLQLGDLVRHKHLGGFGTYRGQKDCRVEHYDGIGNKVHR